MDQLEYEAQLGIKSALAREVEIPAQLRLAEQKAITFGNTFLDASLFGILPNDLVLLGASTGVGKTSMSANIAKTVCDAKKRVLFVALEAEENEIEMRLRYQLYAKHYFLDPQRNKTVNFDYRNYRYNRLEYVTKKYEDKVVAEFSQAAMNLLTYYRKKDFTIKELKELLAWAKSEVDLVIIDHLHYFDFAKEQFGTKGGNEKMSDLVKEIRDLNLYYNVPIVLVAHLRKDIQSLVPSVSDFMGSSDIGKVATCAIMLSKHPQGFDPVNQTSNTIISIAKSRTGSLGVVGLQRYALRYNVYEKPFNVGIAYKDKIKVLNKQELPYWAKDCHWAVGEDEL